MRKDEKKIEGRIFKGLSRLINLRKNHGVFSGSNMEIMNTGNAHVLGYIRHLGTERVLVFANFSEQEQILPANLLRLYGFVHRYQNLLSSEKYAQEDVKLQPFEFLPLACI